MQPLQKEYIKLYTKSLGNLNYLLPMQLRRNKNEAIRISSKCY